MFNKDKTKWKPLYFYNDTGYHKMIFVRYDNKTGLFDFKTKTLAFGCYGLKYSVESQLVLDNLLKKDENNG